MAKKKRYLRAHLGCGCLDLEGHWLIISIRHGQRPSHELREWSYFVQS